MRTNNEQDALRARLSPLAYHVTVECGTEPPFDNPFWNEKRSGLYLDVVSGAPLFASGDKFDSGTGWPSFTRALEPAAVATAEDRAHGMVRTEVRGRSSGAHLGHLFDDGPAPGGLRYCINSAALRFVPLERLAAEGLGRFLPLFGVAAPDTAADAGVVAPPPRAIAILAGGCFWGVQQLLRDLPGVLATRVGYTGGALENPAYADLHGGTSGHAEAVRVEFDPEVLSYESLLVYFFRLHDPTTKNRQGNDVGTQYRSAIFWFDEEQRTTAGRVLARLNSTGRMAGRITTSLEPAGTFWDAEPEHQDYLVRNPGGYTCHWLRPD